MQLLEVEDQRRHTNSPLDETANILPLMRPNCQWLTFGLTFGLACGLTASSPGDMVVTGRCDGLENDRRLVYSTDSRENERCSRCRELLASCTCPPEEAVSANLTIKLRLEKSGRGGKTVTVLYDLPRNPAFLKELASKLKRLCGTGGTAKDTTIELQGDYRERLRQILPTLGLRVKG